MRSVSSLGLKGGESKLQIGYALQIEHGAEEPVSGAYSEIINSVDERGRATVVFTRDGIPDDAVQTEQHVVEADVSRDGRTQVTGYGVRYRCWRGAGAGTWTTGVCG